MGLVLEYDVVNGGIYLNTEISRSSCDKTRYWIVADGRIWTLDLPYFVP